MRLKNKYVFFKIAVLSLLTLNCTLISCKKFVDIPGPKGSQDQKVTFETDGTATAAVLDIYAHQEVDAPNAVFCTGLAADELVSDDATYAEFQNNTITLESFYNGTYLWTSPYFEIRRCNLAIDGINKSATLSPAVKSQLSGETLFMRAYMYFNLVNLYGGVPLALSPVETANALLPRSTPEQVWAQIFADLQQAKSLLKPAYPSTDRARVNQYAVSALLARAYLYQKDWAKAESEATEVIGSNVYSLAAPANTFKTNSNETILQLYTQTGTSSITPYFFLPEPAVNPVFYLRDGFEQAFEKTALGADDARKTNWTAKNDNGINYVNKYKVPFGTGDEYTILMRLAEIYLIRAEARANQNKLTGTTGAEADLNVIRTRAGLTAKLNLDKAAMLKAIEQERKVELFAEYTHRWFDLKRTPGFTDLSKSRAEEVLPALKGDFWQATDVLFPIPGDQLSVNKNLTQNPGY